MTFGRRFLPAGIHSSFELVSRNWKDILDTFPNLWSYVNILIERMPSIAYAHYIGNQLSRSRQCPLSVSICHSDRRSVTRLGAFPVAILITLFLVSRRVQTLHLCLPGRYFADMQQFHLSFPILRELVLYSSSETSEVAQHLHFNSLPNLRVFHATDVSNIERLSLPWHQINHFTNMHEAAGRGLSAPRALSILKMMPHVSVCCLSLELQSLMTRVEQTTLNKLRSLTLSSVSHQNDTHPPVIHFLLDRLRLPALLDLSVSCLVGSFWREEAVAFTSIRQLIERSHCPLTSLYFSEGVIRPDDLIHTLSITPTLQDLQLMGVGGGFTDEVPNHLARRVNTESDSQVPALVPHLHILHLNGTFRSQMKVYAQMFESRWTCHPRHLKSVNICRHLYSWDSEDEVAEARNILPRLDALRSEGLDMTMSTRRA
ncbi:hypothetical protein ARMGADRAFT_729656 [Armillaria gallica]|uniref:F-box domain-containing protein n=1 Tax=Armillaria gallica TaxID=47427 RepID=A0A2H3D2V4_ARMGA|nr:hypothetical protein ARMGADRAFT_729656 [Armillaria gallica]